MVIVGEAATEEPVEELKEPAGDHVYELAPLAVKVALLGDPAQIAVAVDAGVIVKEFTVTVTFAEFVHPLRSAPVTVYVCVEEGVKATPSVTPPLHV